MFLGIWRVILEYKIILIFYDFGLGGLFVGNKVRFGDDNGGL